MASPPTSPGSSAPQTPLTEPGPSNITGSPSNKRPASTSLSDSETLVTRTTKTPASGVRKGKRAIADAFKRRKKRKKLPITQFRSQINRVSLAKSPVSPKGKEREIEENNQDGEANENCAPAEENDELVQLRKKVDEQGSLLNAHNDFLQSLAPSITCQICLDPMYRPYTLAPCGHTACYDCLLAWFRAPPAHVGNPPPQHLVFNFDPNVPTLLARDAPMLLGKDKTCPHCRAIVRDAPVEAWGIKDIVNHLFAHKGEAVKDLFPSHTGPQEGAATPSGADAWKGVFRSARINRTLIVPGANRDRLAGLVHDDDSVIGDGPQPFFDEEDGVYRCRECYHEIWDGTCSSCGRLYPGHRDEFADEDEELDGGNWMDAEDFHGLDGEHLNLVGGDVDEHVQGIMGALGFHRRLYHRGDEDDSDEDNYEGSFIDDGDDPIRMEEYHSAEEAGDYDSEDVEMRGVDEDEDNLPRRVPPPRVDESDDDDVPPRVRLGTVEIHDSDSDLGDTPISRGAQTSRFRIDSDDDDDVTAGSQRAGRVPGPSRGRRAIINDSDSEPDEDEHSDVVNRRNRHPYRSYTRSLSDEEESLSEDGSDHSSRHGSFHGSASGLSHENYDNYVFSDEDGYLWSD